MQGEFILLPGRYDPPCHVFRRPRVSVVALGVACLLSYSAYRGLASLQSSVNPSGLGTSSLAGTALFFCGTLLLLTAVQEEVDRMLGVVGYRGTIAASLTACSSHVLAQSLLQFPHSGNPVGVYVPAILVTSGVAGVGGALMAYCTLRYVENIVREHPQLTAMTTTLFLACWKLATIGGNLVSAVVLSMDSMSNPQCMTENITNACGLNFWPGDKYLMDNENSNLNRPTNYIMNWICGIYFGFMVLSVLIVIFGVEDPKRSEEPDDTVISKMAHIHKDVTTENKYDDNDRDTLLYTLLLVPMLMSLGLGHAFFEADFTSAFVTCILGLKYVGWMMMYSTLLEGLGVVMGLYAVTSNVPRVSVVVTAVLLQIGFLVYLQLPIATMQVAVMCAGVAAFGLGSGLILATTALVKTSRLAPFMLFQMMGLVLGYSYSVHLRTDLKLYTLVTSTLVGLVAYLAAEIHRTILRPHNNVTDHKRILTTQSVLMT